MYSLTYVSSAVDPLSDEDLAQLLIQCKFRNDRDQITGMLLYKDGSFMQVIEGNEAAVRATYARILADSRHDGHIILLEGAESERCFPGWSMGFEHLGSDLPKPDGYREFLNSPLTADEFGAAPVRARQLLSAFKASR